MHSALVALQEPSDKTPRRISAAEQARRVGGWSICRRRTGTCCKNTQLRHILCPPLRPGRQMGPPQTDLPVRRSTGCDTSTRRCSRPTLHHLQQHRRRRHHRRRRRRFPILRHCHHSCPNSRTRRRYHGKAGCPCHRGKDKVRDQNTGRFRREHTSIPWLPGTLEPPARRWLRRPQK